MYKKFCKKYNLRKFDWKDMIFFMISLFALGLSIGIDIKDTESSNEIKSLSAQLVYQSNLNSYYEEELLEIRDLYNTIESFPQINYSNMTKSEILEKEEEIKIFMESLENFNLENNILYKNLKKELNNCYEVLEKGEYLYPYTYEDYCLLAYIIKREAGSNYLTDEQRDLVGLVVLNRVNSGGINMDLKNPSIADILNEPGQYPYKSWDFDGSNIPYYCYESAVRVLEHKVTCPENVVYQATFKQGSGVYKQFTTPGTNTTTFFCYR